MYNVINELVIKRIVDCVIHNLGEMPLLNMSGIDKSLVLHEGPIVTI